MYIVIIHSEYCNEILTYETYKDAEIRYELERNNGRNVSLTKVLRNR